MGKSIIIQKKIIEELKINPGGFMTGCNREGDQTSLYFTTVTNNLNKTLKCSDKPFAMRRNRSSLWEVNNSVFNIFAVELLEKGLNSEDILIMDELGRFELGALQFQEKVEEVLLSPELFLEL